MRRSMNGTRSASNGGALAGRQATGGAMTRRGTATDENQALDDKMTRDDENLVGMAGPVTARLKMLEKRYSQVLDMQAKFSILDKWIQQQFRVKLFPSAVVNAEKFEEGNPEDADNPFYAVYLMIQRVKFLEDKVRQLEARPFEDMPEPKPTSNYSSTHAFRNFKAAKGPGGGVKRGYVSSSPTTPKKAKLLGRPVATSATYPLKPSVKILPRDPSMPSPVKKDKEQEASKGPSSARTVSDGNKADAKPDKEKPESKIADGGITEELANNKDGKETKTDEIEKMDTDDVTSNAEKETSVADSPSKNVDENLVTLDAVSSQDVSNLEMQTNVDDMDVKKEVNQDDDHVDGQLALEDGLPILEDATADLQDEDIMDESDQEEVDLEVEQKPAIPLEDEGGEVSGSEASVSSLASSSSKPRLSTRRRQAVVGSGTAATATSVAASEKAGEDEKPVMYTARGRRHTVPRRYAEFTGHDNVVSILKSQQRAEKNAAAAGSSKGGRRQPATPTKSQDTPPKIKKMVKTAKTPSPKKLPLLTDSDGEGEPGSSKKKMGPSVSSNERPPCVDALVDRVMAREVDSDGMVVLAESYPNIFVNQQQLITVIVRSNGKSTRLTRKMTTLVFEDSVLASASPFGTKYYKDRLPPEPLEAMVDFIADSGFEPHYSKKKIYMIVGQVCNEARAGRVSRKFMHPLEATPGSSQASTQEAPSSVPPSPTPESSPQ